jgi:hypothetical protein
MGVRYGRLEYILEAGVKNRIVVINGVKVEY